MSPETSTETITNVPDTYEPSRSSKKSEPNLVEDTRKNLGNISELFGNLTQNVLNYIQNNSIIKEIESYKDTWGDRNNSTAKMDIEMKQYTLAALENLEKKDPHADKKMIDAAKSALEQEIKNKDDTYSKVVDNALEVVRMHIDSSEGKSFNFKADPKDKSIGLFFGQVDGKAMDMGPRTLAALKWLNGQEVDFEKLNQVTKGIITVQQGFNPLQASDEYGAGSSHDAMYNRNYDSENIDTDTTDKIIDTIDKLQPRARERLKQISKELGVNPLYLVACMSFETGGTFDPAKTNGAGSGATGLIQFMPDTAIGLGTSTEALAKMTQEEQLEYVRKYFLADKDKLKSLEDTYMAILWPAAVGKSNDSNILDPGSYNQNSGLDKNGDGNISKEEATQMVREHLNKY